MASAASLSWCPQQAPSAGRRSRVRASASASAVSVPIVVKESGAFTSRGTVRKVNEDRYDVKVSCWSCLFFRARLRGGGTIAPLCAAASCAHAPALPPHKKQSFDAQPGAAKGAPISFAGVYDGHGTQTRMRACAWGGAFG